MVESQDDKSFFLASLHWITLSWVRQQSTIYLLMMKSEILLEASLEPKRTRKPWTLPSWLVKKDNNGRANCLQGDYFMAINKQIMQLSLHLISSPLATLSNINTTTMTMALGKIKYLSIMFISMLTSTLSNHHHRHWYARTERQKNFSRALFVWTEYGEEGGR